MKKKLDQPIIGVSPNFVSYAIPGILGLKKIFINEDYATALFKAGAFPVVLPITQDLEAVTAYVTMIDGLMLSGGDDVNPLLYGEEPTHKVKGINPERDQFEIALIRETLAQKKPILGICRGMQILNVALGGTLYQDIPIEAPGIQHLQNSKEYVGTHSVDLLEGSKLRIIMDSDTTVANSFHHQSIKDLAPSLKISAKSKDGIIEGVEMIDENFIVGVQWHPECMVNNNIDMLQLFTQFAEAASIKKKLNEK